MMSEQCLATMHVKIPLLISKRNTSNRTGVCFPFTPANRTLTYIGLTCVTVRASSVDFLFLPSSHLLFTLSPLLSSPQPSSFLLFLLFSLSSISHSLFPFSFRPISEILWRVIQNELISLPQLDRFRSILAK
ncbi:hypothetical protein I3843_02G138300 [Carya illinoinensis]|nr:hypothetical protein I3843_02G138300 [Carya illinoinensis]